MIVETIPKNIFRGIDNLTGETHYFVGSYDEESGTYRVPMPRKHKTVMGTYIDEKIFPTLEEAISYKGYTDYAVAAQAALSYYNVSRIAPKGWDKNLGSKYSPWFPKRYRKIR